VGALQLVLDRGQIMDWFTSREIHGPRVVASLAFYLFLVHMCHAPTGRSFPPVVKDRNFASAIIMVFCISGIMQRPVARWRPICKNSRVFAARMRGGRWRREGRDA